MQCMRNVCVLYTQILKAPSRTCGQKEIGTPLPTKIAATSIVRMLSALTTTQQAKGQNNNMWDQHGSMWASTMLLLEKPLISTSLCSCGERHTQSQTLEKPDDL